MKKFVKSILGVTLLEVMLVLAIAAMIIVMSVRYYQSTQAANQANTVVGEITSIVAAMDSLAQTTGAYTGLTTAQVQAVVPANSMTTPWGTNMTVAVNTASSYTITIPTAPSNVCPLVISKLKANSHFNPLVPNTAAACPPTAGNITATYISNP